MTFQKNWWRKHAQILGRSAWRRDFANDLGPFSASTTAFLMSKSSCYCVPASVFPFGKGRNCGSLCQASHNLQRQTWFKSSFLQQSILQVYLYNKVSAGTAGHSHVSSSVLPSKLLPKSQANEVNCTPPVLLAAPGLIVWGQFIYKSTSHGICHGEGSLLCRLFALLAESLHT